MITILDLKVTTPAHLDHSLDRGCSKFGRLPHEIHEHLDDVFDLIPGVADLMPYACLPWEFSGGSNYLIRIIFIGCPDIETLRVVFGLKNINIFQPDYTWYPLIFRDGMIWSLVHANSKVSWLKNKVNAIEDELEYGENETEY